MEEKTINILKDMLSDARKVYTLDICYRGDTEFAGIQVMELVGLLCKDEEIVTTEPDLFQGGYNHDQKFYRLFVRSDRGQIDFNAYVQTLVDSRFEIDYFLATLLTLDDLESIDKTADLKKTEQVSGHQNVAYAKTVRVELPALLEIGSLIRMLGDIHAELKNFHESLEPLPKQSDNHESLKLIDQKHGMVLKKMSDALNNLKIESLAKLFAKSAQITKDLAQTLNKKVSIQLSGSEIKIDKVVNEYLKDAFIHILRNCIDHGIEAPEERERLGKPKNGTIRIFAETDDRVIRIEISDDGAGIDLEKIRTIAKKNETLKHLTIDALKENELLDLLFLPNFSTRQNVSTVSGRGVGLDVVRTNLQIVGGTVEIKTVPGTGTTFRIILPIHASEEIIRAGEAADRPADDDYFLCIAEIDELLQVMDLELEKMRLGEIDPAMLQEFYRKVHTIKGLAAFCHEDAIVKLSHNFEELLHMVIDRNIQFSTTMLETASSLIDTINGIVAGISLGTGLQIDTGSLLKKIDSLIQKNQRA